MSQELSNKKVCKCIVCKKEFLNITKWNICSRKCSTIISTMSHLKVECLTCKKGIIIDKYNRFSEKISYLYCSHSCEKRKTNIDQNVFDEINEYNAEYLGYFFAVAKFNPMGRLIIEDSEENIKKIIKFLDTGYPYRYMKNKKVYLLKIKYFSHLKERLEQLGFDGCGLNSVMPEIQQKEKFLKGFMYSKASIYVIDNGIKYLETKIKSSKLAKQIANLLDLKDINYFNGNFVIRTLIEKV